MRRHATKSHLRSDIGRPRFRQPRVFYSLVITAIVLPNIVLGLYGYAVVTDLNDRQAKATRRATEGLVVAVTGAAIADLEARLGALPTRLPSDVDAEIADDSEALRRVLWERVRPAMLAVGRRRGRWIREVFFVDPAIRTILPAPKEDANDADDAEPSPDASGKRFERNVFPHLKDVGERLRSSTGPDVRFVVPDESQDVRYAVLRVTRHNEELVARAVVTLEPGTLREALRARLGAFGGDTARNASVLSPSTPRWRPTPAHELAPPTRIVATVKGPYRGYGVRLESDTAAQDRFTTLVTRFLTLAAVVLPLVSVGGFLLVRGFARELREARIKTDFVSRVTHELKTPLTAIRMFVEMLRDSRVQTDEERDHCLAVIQQESERLTRLIDRVLDFSKFEARNKVFHFEITDPEEVIREAIAFFRSQIADKGGTIRLYIEKNLDLMVMDRDAIREVLLNLFTNALKYSLHEKLIGVRVAREAKNLSITVSDHGIGIPQEDLASVFDKFFRVDEPATRGIEGTGLGLTLAREIARVHGGEITVESERGRGSKFTVILPLDFTDPNA